MTAAVRARLREETRQWHESLERELDLVSPALALERYQHILSKFWGFYVPWERIASEVFPGAIADRRKTPNLCADLQYFGIDPQAQPVCRRMPLVQSAAEALGGCYVFEGATLGGQIISRHLQQKLGVGPANGGRFFHGYGPDTGAMWRSFEEMVHQYCEGSRADETVAAAKATFGAFASWLREGA